MIVYNVVSSLFYINYTTLHYTTKNLKLDVYVSIQKIYLLLQRQTLQLVAMSRQLEFFRVHLCL